MAQIEIRFSGTHPVHAEVWIDGVYHPEIIRIDECIGDFGSTIRRESNRISAFIEVPKEKFWIKDGNTLTFKRP